jgi:hypothetical protein
MNKSKTYKYIITGIKILLGLSILTSIGVIIFNLTANGPLTLAEKINHSHRNVELLFSALMTLGLVMLPEYIEKRRNIKLPEILSGAITLFIFASIYLSARLALYNTYFWWDDLLHTLSGVIIGFIGFLLIYKINKKYSMNISPLLVAIFAFCFAITFGVFWEIAEFTSDALLKTSTQKWDLPANAILMGRAYQGSGLRDTMSDLILDVAGAFVTSVICYFLYKNEKHNTLKAMRNAFPER